MKLRLQLLNESAPTNSMGLSSTVHQTGAYDTYDPSSLFNQKKIAKSRPSVARAKQRAKKSLRDKLAGRRVNETKHFLTWNGRKFEIKPSRNGKNRAILPQPSDRYIATAKKPVKLGRSTPLIVNPSMQQTRNRVGDTRFDGNSRGSSTVEEGLGGIVGAAIGTYIGNKIRKRLQQRRSTKPAPTTSGPWGAHVQNPTGPKIRQRSTETRSDRRASSSSSPPPTANNNHMSAADFKDLVKKNPTIRVSSRRKI